MDRVTQEDASPQAELTLLPSPKRQRTDCSVTKDISGNSMFDTSDTWTSQKSCLSPRNLQKTDRLTITAECGHHDHKNPCDKAQDSTSTSATHLTTLHSSDAHTESSDECFFDAERDEKPLATKTDTLSLYLRDDADVCPSATSSNTPSLPHCSQLINDEAFGIYSLPNDNDEDEAQTNVSQLQEDAFCSNQPDCSSKDGIQDLGLCNTGSQPTEAVETNQEIEEVDFNVPPSKAEGESPISSMNFEDPNPLNSNSEENLSGLLAADGKNEQQKSELWICGRENVFVCDVKTKEQVNENSMSQTLIFTAAQCAERSVLRNAVVLDTSIENGSFEINKYIEADHWAEMPVASKISQEPAEGDNDADAFGVIDPAICSEIDKEVEGRLCNSDSTAGIELSALGQISHMEAAHMLSQVSASDQNEEFNHQDRTEQDKNEIKCQSEPQTCSVTNNKTQAKTDNESNCQSSPSSDPEKPSPAEVGGRLESHNAVGQELNERRQSSCCAVRLDHMKMQEVEYSKRETDNVDEAAVINGRKEAAQFLEKENNEQEKSQQQNKQDKEDGCLGEETRKQDSKLNRIDGEQELESLCNKPFCPDTYGIDVTAEGIEQRGVMNVGKEIKTNGCESSEIRGNSQDNKENQSPITSNKTQNRTVREESPDGSTSEWLEGGRLAFFNADDSEQSLSCFSLYQHRSDISVPFTFPPASDAVVPCQPYLSHSENALSSSTALKSSDRFPPSAFTLFKHVLGGFDTFEKIKLSPDDDDDDDAGPGSMPILTSSPAEKTPQHQLHHHMPKAELDIHNKISVEEKDGGKEEEEVERLECHIENMANGFVSSDSACNDAPNLISAADVIVLAWPEQQPDCGSAYDSSELTHKESNPQSECSAVPPECDSPPSDLNNSFEFEMKEQFSRVLKELSLFFDISRNDFASDCRPSSPEQCDTPEPLERNTSKSTEDLSSPEGRHRDETSPEEADEDHSLDMCGVDPVVSLPAGGAGEQEVPLNRNLCQEQTTETTGNHIEPQEVEAKVKTWSPNFMYLPLMEQLKPPAQARRLEPLKTCIRPIRVGLSKRAKTKHLHRSHPYK